MGIGRGGSTGLSSAHPHVAALDFPLTTDPNTVATFFRSSSFGKHIVFSTYRSAHVLAEALAGSRFSTAPVREDPLDDLRPLHAGD